MPSGATSAIKNAGDGVIIGRKRSDERPRTVPNPRSFRSRFGAPAHAQAFLAMVWGISPGLTAAVAAAAARPALVPVAGLYVGS